MYDPNSQLLDPIKYKASVDFYKIYPSEYLTELQGLIWNENELNRESKWQELNVPYKKIEKAFIALAKQRNSLASESGYTDLIDKSIKQFKIPLYSFDLFLKNKEKVINYCHDQLIDFNIDNNKFFREFGNHCYICELDPGEFKSLTNIRKVFIDSDEVLKNYNDKINFSEGNGSYTSFDKQSGVYKITIDKRQNNRHKIIDSIHEISHAKSTIISQNESKTLDGAYSKELATLKFELEILKKHSLPIYKTIFGEFLKVYLRVLFELELYKNPDQDLSRLYASSFNLCFIGAKQKNNRSYILDNLIIKYPLATLPHAIAQSEVILSLM